MKAFWIWLRSNPYFVAASSALATFASSAVYQWIQQGTPALTPAELKQTALAAVGVIAMALYHQYTPTPAQAAVAVAALPVPPVPPAPPIISAPLSK